MLSCTQRQLRASEAPSLLVFLPISTDFTLTPGIPFTSLALEFGSFECNSMVKPLDFTSDFPNRLRTLYTQSIRTTLATSVLPRLLAQS